MVAMRLLALVEELKASQRVYGMSFFWWGKT